ncbi:MAG: hypothetical protein ACOYMG_03635 [Candidatus Methylumidiphilus sp.]
MPNDEEIKSLLIAVLKKLEADKVRISNIEADIEQIRGEQRAQANALDSLLSGKESASRTSNRTAVRANYSEEESPVGAELNHDDISDTLQRIDTIDACVSWKKWFRYKAIAEHEKRSGKPFDIQKANRSPTAVIVYALQLGPFYYFFLNMRNKGVMLCATMAAVFMYAIFLSGDFETAGGWASVVWMLGAALAPHDYYQFKVNGVQMWGPWNFFYHHKATAVFQLSWAGFIAGSVILAILSIGAFKHKAPPAAYVSSAEPHQAPFNAGPTQREQRTRNDMLNITCEGTMVGVPFNLSVRPSEGVCYFKTALSLGATDTFHLIDFRGDSSNATFECSEGNSGDALSFVITNGELTAVGGNSRAATTFDQKLLGVTIATSTTKGRCR